MNKLKNTNAITLLALVITIIIMLLLAAVAIQMTFGENGLIIKATQAKIQQAKAELYDTAKLSFLNLKTKALENGLTEPEVELAITTSEFISKYNVVGDNITDKNNEIIDTKDNLFKMLSESVSSSNMPYIANEDKDKLILELNVTTTSDLEVINFMSSDPVKVEFDDGTIGEAKYPGCFCPTVTKTFSPGKYIVKFVGAVSYHLSGITVKIDSTKAHFNILNWGKDPLSYTGIDLYGVDKIYAPEPDFLAVAYRSAIFNKIPKNLFSKKSNNNTYVSSFIDCNNITEIPEDLLKNWVNLETAPSFSNCKNLQHIPENLFKYNTNIINFNSTFEGCTCAIPENIFKYNTKAKSFYATFAFVDTNIPENVFKYNILAENFRATFFKAKITAIPENIFEHNINANNFDQTFEGCSKLLYVPPKIIDKVLSAPNHNITFSACTSVSNYSQIPSSIK